MNCDSANCYLPPSRPGRSLVSLILLALSCLALAAEPQYGFEHFTVEDGLPQDVIRGIAQTPDGYLWIATLDGLVRFDGVKFTLFDRNNTPGLISNRFREMHPGRNGDLWLTNENDGVTRYHDGVFLSYGMNRGIPTTAVSALSVSGAGDVSILAGNRILQWNEAGGKFVAVTPQRTKIFYVQLQWETTGFWGQDGAKIHCFANGRFVDYALPPWLDHDAVWGAAVDQQGALWVEILGGKQAKIAQDGTVQAIKTRDHATMQFVDSQGRPWKMRVGAYLTRSLVFESSGKTKTIPVTRLFEDRQATLWFGTEGEGLYHLEKQSISVYSKDQGLADSDDYAVYQDHAGGLWIGAWHVGLSHFAGGKFVNYSQANGLPGRNVTAILADREGRLWVGSYGGLAIFDHGRFHKVTEPSLPAGMIAQAICQDSEGTLWFGTTAGLSRYKNGVTKLFTSKDGLASDDVHVIVEDKAGDLWIGGYGGLTRIHRGLFTRWTERDGLPGNTIWSIYEDKDRVLWIGTYDSGLVRFKAGSFSRFQVKDGLFSNGVFQILEDAHGRLWISCNRGIYRVSKRELDEFATGTRGTITSVAYGRIDGMLSVECNGGIWPAGTRTKDGKLWFPTLNGVAVINPETIVSDVQPPPVIIESALLDRAPISVTRPLRIYPGQRNLEIHYTAPAFVKANQTHFKYKLEGQEPEWVDAGSRRTANYAHLPPGRYLFHVIAGNSDGVWNLTGVSLSVTVLAPFYQTWWFAAVIFFAAGAAIAAAWRYRVSQLDRSRTAQQAFSRQLLAFQENERKRIAAELHDSLGQRLVVINNLALLALRRSRDEKNRGDGGANTIDPLAIEEISSETKLAIQETREISYNLRPFQLDRLGLTKAIQVMIRTIAKSTALRISAELNDIDDLFAEELRINFYRIVQEGLNNVVKHASATQVDISIQRNGERTLLSIKDNGRGFALAGRAGSTDQSGFGLTGMAERASLLGGELQLQSEAGRGTLVTVAFTTLR